jgi:hypothetical protein
MRAVVPVRQELAQRAAGHVRYVELLVAQVLEAVGRSEDQPLAIGGKHRHALANLVVRDAAHLAGG